MRKKIVAGNWKMNLDANAAENLFQSLKNVPSSDEVNLVIFPTALYLQNFSAQNEGHLKIGAQNFYPADEGAFTGEVSISQLKAINVEYVLIGHSERRAYFGEHSEFLKDKVNAALEYNMVPVFCCGEPLSIREKNEEYTFVKKQLEEALFHLDANQLKKCVIAYEPVWAIGTGLTATSEQAEAMHRSIRAWISEKYGDDVATEISILYGGSCNASNAKELFSCPNVDGGLIGGASLKADQFTAILNSF